MLTWAAYRRLAQNVVDLRIASDPNDLYYTAGIRIIQPLETLADRVLARPELFRMRWLNV